MAAQAFFYNAIFFTYALVLTDFYGIRADHVGWYLLPFAAGNFLGPVLLGRLFDTVGRRPMIALTYALGVLLAGSGYLFAIGVLSATGQTVAWMVIFFFASAAAGSAYLTVSETFARDPRARHRLLLRHRYRHRRRRRALAVPGADRHRLALERVRRLPARRRADDRGGAGRRALRRRRRAQAAGKRVPSARRCRLSDYGLLAAAGRAVEAFPRVIWIFPHRRDDVVDLVAAHVGMRAPIEAAVHHLVGAGKLAADAVVVVGERRLAGEVAADDRPGLCPRPRGDRAIRRGPPACG